jgi:dTMP kinase
LFITFEGLDGAGKSTQIHKLKTRMLESGLKVVFTHEPGGTPVGDKVRALLLNPEDVISPAAEVFLYAASRAELVREIIRPALDRGEVVLCDRFVDASLAYQGAGLGVGVEQVRDINQFATGGLKPDVTFLFDIPVVVSQDRVQNVRQQTKPDRIERRDSEYFKRVRDEFLRIAKQEEERVIVLDAELSPDVLEQEIWQAVSKYLVNRGRPGVIDNEVNRCRSTRQG